MTARAGECDVVVIGGGPAGSAIALELARAGRHVVMIEKSRYETARVGETLPGAVRPALERLGLWDEFLAAGHRPAPATLSVWGEPEIHTSHSIFNPYGHGWHVDRQRFDRMLAGAAARAGVRLRVAAQVSSGRPLRAGGWQLETGSAPFKGQRGDHLRTPLVVDATGRAAAWARKQGAKRMNDDQLVALVCWLAPRDPRNDTSACVSDAPDDCTLVEACVGGWWYAASVPSGAVVATYVTDRDALPSPSEWPAFWQARLQETTCTRARLATFRLAGRPQVMAATSSRLDCITGVGWLAVGDAAIAFDPLSSQGLFHALQSGVSAGVALERRAAGDAEAIQEHARSETERYREHVRLRAIFYGRERRWPGSLFWRRRQAVTASNAGATRLSVHARESL
jgi:flavin-dependent dehydrogenase